MTGAEQLPVHPAQKAKETNYFDGRLAWLARIVAINDGARVTKAIAIPSRAAGGDGAVADLGRLQISPHVITDASRRVTETFRRRSVRMAAADSASFCPISFRKKSASAIASVGSRLAFTSAAQLDRSLGSDEGEFDRYVHQPDPALQLSGKASMLLAQSFHQITAPIQSPYRL